jgi:hypothetical protein
MFARSDMLASAPRGQCATHAALPPRASAGLALAVLLLAGCAGVPSAPIAGAHPADRFGGASRRTFEVARQQ